MECVLLPDGARIVTASEDHTARLWDATTGMKITALRGHEDAVLSASFSPDGTRIVTASNDHTARLWDATTGHEIIALRGHENWVSSASFSPDGARRSRRPSSEACKVAGTASDDAGTADIDA